MDCIKLNDKKQPPVKLTDVPYGSRFSGGTVVRAMFGSNFNMSILHTATDRAATIQLPHDTIRIRIFASR